MKTKIIFAAISAVFMLLASSLSADEIVLKNGETVSCKILKVGSRFIEYDPDGKIPYVTIPVSKVSEIIYLDGSAFVIKALNPEEAGDKNVDRDASVSKEALKKPDGSIEFELGFNGYVGAGFRINRTVWDGLTANGGVGYGVWGTRFSAGLRYCFNPDLSGIALGLGAAYNTGKRGYNRETDIITADGLKLKNDVIYDYKPVTVVNLTFLYSWNMNESTRFYIETGYSHAFQKDNYTMKSDAYSGFTLTDDEKDYMNVEQPGGIIFSLGISIMFH